MKKSICLSLLLFVIFACASTKKTKQENYVFVEGSDLYYEVNAGGETYSFDLNLNEFTADVISFDWEMAGSNSGTIAMTSSALQNAMSLKNNFSGGYKLLENQTSVWVSAKLFNELKADKDVEIDLGNGQKDTFKKSREEIYSIKDKSNETGPSIPLSVFVATSKTGDKEIWILNDANNRLIVKMDIGFQVDLKGWRM